MAKIYAALIQKGIKTIDDVPAGLRDEVQRILDGETQIKGNTFSDWTQIQDVALTEAKKAEWIVYRQTLRDIPENYTNPDEVIFPDEPENAQNNIRRLL